MIYEVELSFKAKKQLRKIPVRITKKLMGWVDSVRLQGLENVRKIPGYHDENLGGKRRKQRSIRLSIHYRAIYEIKKDGHVEFVSVEEVNKHEY